MAESKSQGEKTWLAIADLYSTKLGQNCLTSDPLNGYNGLIMIKHTETHTKNDVLKISRGKCQMSCNAPYGLRKKVLVLT